MEVFKICREKYSRFLHASGVSNRWNKKDEFVIYTGSSRSLSTLEMVVHRSYINISSSYKLLLIVITDESLIKEIKINELPEHWKTLEAYLELQEMGSKWYNSNESLVLKVPSAIVPQEYNYIINTKHPKFSTHIILQDVDDLVWDKRLL
jgi:RES domain-containing protein